MPPTDEPAARSQCCHGWPVSGLVSGRDSLLPNRRLPIGAPEARVRQWLCAVPAHLPLRGQRWVFTSLPVSSGAHHFRLAPDTVRDGAANYPLGAGVSIARRGQRVAKALEDLGGFRDLRAAADPGPRWHPARIEASVDGRVMQQLLRHRVVLQIDRIEQHHRRRVGQQVFQR